MMQMSGPFRRWRRQMEIETPLGTVVFECGSMDDEMVAALRNLFAAAPELLAACKEMLQTLKEEGLVSQDVPPWECQHRRWDNSIAKAEKSWNRKMYEMADSSYDRLGEENRQLKSMLAQCRDLRSEIDCRVQHGAESGGHLEYVLQELNQILAKVADFEWIPEQIDND